MPQEEIDSPTYVMGSLTKKSLAAKVADRVRSFTPGAAEEAAKIYPVEVIDVSVWNGNMNFNEAKKHAQAVIIRAGFGNDGIDPNAEINVVKAYNAGMPWGLYWYVKAGKDFKKHVINFKAMIDDLKGDLTPVSDCENTSCATKTLTTDWLYKYEKNFYEAFSFDSEIYTRKSWWDYNTYRQDWPKRCDLFVAFYSDTATEPPIPNDWGAIKNPVPFTKWQWSAVGNNLGEEYGAEGDDIDRSRFNGTVAQFNSKYGTHITEIGVEPPTPPPSVTTFSFQVIVDSLNIRSGPGKDYADVGDLRSGDIVVPTNVDGTSSWIEIAPGKWACVTLNGTRFMNPIQPK